MEAKAVNNTKAASAAQAITPFAPPRWRIAQLAQRMSTNQRNILRFRSDERVWIEKTYAEVYRQASDLVLALDREGLPLAPGFALVLLGPSGYNWCLAALAGILCGSDLIAVPETLLPEDVEHLLEEIKVDGAILCTDALGFAAFAKVPRFSMADCASVHSGLSVDPSTFRPQLRVLAFTSGSTSGQQLKGFWVDGERTEVYMESFLVAFGLRQDDRWGVCHTLSHVVHLEKVVGGFVWGYDVTLMSTVDFFVDKGTLQLSGFTTVPAVWEQIAAQLRRSLPASGVKRRLIDWFLEWPVNGVSRYLARVLQPWLFPQVRTLLGNRLKLAIIGTAPSKPDLKRFLTLCGIPLYEGYGMSEVGLIAINTAREYRFGSVGKLFPGIGAYISASGELFIATGFKRATRYENTPLEDSNTVFVTDDLLCTGDIATLDEDGYLFIKGRTKNVIITDRGENINPVPIELALLTIPGVAHAVVYGDGSAYLSAILSPIESNVPLQREAIRAAIYALNGTLPNLHQIGNFLTVTTPFSVAEGTLTRLEKPNRPAIWALYGPELAWVARAEGVG